MSGLMPKKTRKNFTRKQKILLIPSIVVFGIGIFLVANFSQQEYVKLDRDSQILDSTIAFSAIGLFIFAIREKKGLDKNFVEAMEALIMIITLEKKEKQLKPIEKSESNQKAKGSSTMKIGKIVIGALTGVTVLYAVKKLAAKNGWHRIQAQ